MTIFASHVSSLSLTLFGPMQVLVEGHPLPPLRSRKSLWLLALLTLRGGRPVEREWLAGTLWPEVTERRAAMNLRVVLSELRRALGSQGGRLQSPSRHTLSLDLDDADADVRTFDAALVSQELEALKQAVALCRGPLLENCAEEWIEPERRTRERECLGALQTLSDAAFASEDFSAAADFCRQAIILDPWRESARRGLMSALVRSGDTNAALETYQAFLHLLRKDDPRAAPDAQTTALYAQLRSEARRQSAAPSMPVAAKVAPAVTGYLPHPLTDLVGREDEREEVLERLRRSRLVTLTGPGGIGKTRLALAVAEEAAPEFAEGVWLVALDALSDGEQVPAQIAGTLGVKEEPGRTLLSSLSDHLREKQLLLVLDNCEHLLDASAQAAASLLQACVGLRVLATSREVLGLTGEAVWAVPSLTVPNLALLPTAPDALVHRLIVFESVQLFVERAQSVQKTFDLTPSNALAVAHICARVEGIPLAIELAAARVRSLAVEQIAARLDDHFALLMEENKAAPSRQQTLKATLDWSYELLTPPEQLLLERVSVFSGGWALESAEVVCSDADLPTGQVLDLLTSLADKSLVVYENAGEGGRCRLLEMVRQYAASRLAECGRESLLRARHRDWFLQIAEKANLPVLEREDLRQSLRNLERDQDNLRSALAWCEKDADGGQAGLQMTGALWRFWAERGDYSEGRAFLQRALAREDAQGVTSALGRAWRGAAGLAFLQGDYVSARAHYEQALSVYRELGDRDEISSALGNLNEVANSQGDAAAGRAYFDEALAHYQQSLFVPQSAEGKQQLAHKLNHLGTLASNQAVFAQNHGGFASASYEETQALLEQSRRFNEQCLSIYQELGNGGGAASQLNNLGSLSQSRGRTARAYGRLEEAQEFCKTAQVYLEQSLSLYQEMGHQKESAFGLRALGVLAYDLGNFAAARTRYEQSLKISLELGDKKQIAYLFRFLALAARDQTDYDSAQAYFAEFFPRCRELGDQLELATGLEGIASMRRSQSRLRSAVRLWSAAQSLRERIGAPLALNKQEKQDEELNQARTALGNAAFEAAWKEGRALNAEQAVAEALKDSAEN